MKATRKVGFAIATVSLIAIVSAFSTHAQGTFQNLNFESAFGLPSTTTPTLVSATNAFPGWTVSDSGGNPDLQVYYNGISVGAALVSLVGTNSTEANPALDGKYSAALAAGEGNSTGLIPVSIYQTGTIPSSARSILFMANYNASSLSVQFGGQIVPYILLSSSPGYQTYGGDISAFAGQTGQLQFTESPPSPNQFAISYLDDIQFSMNSIPEPSTWALLALGGGALLLRRRKAA